MKEEQKKDPEKIPSAILRKVLPRTCSGVIAHLPDRRNLAMTTGRKKSQSASPKSLEELEDIPESYQKTITGDQFLHYDSRDTGDIEGRVIVSATRRNLELLSTSKVWYLGGTFKVCLYI